MKLSVILPCFNGSATVAVQLEALTRQQWPGGWEVIAVDNGSTDSSVEIIRRYQDRLPGLKIVQAHTPGMPRLGVPHSYNTGIQAAEGDAFVFCEADDEVAPGWLQSMGEALCEHPFVVARLEHARLNPAWVLPPGSEAQRYSGLSRSASPPYLYWASGAAFGLQRSMYMALGPLSTEFPIAHDMEYCWRAQSAGYPLYLEPRAVVHYREKTRLKDRFIQGRNWGRDSARLERHLGAQGKPFPVLRHGAFLLRMGSTGLVVAAVAIGSRGLGPRRRLADWVWNFGWAVGTWTAIGGDF